MRNLIEIATGDDRGLADAARAKDAATETHRSLADEQAAVSIEEFSLWYGQSQALFDVSMIVPRGGKRLVSPRKNQQSNGNLTTP